MHGPWCSLSPPRRQALTKHRKFKFKNFFPLKKPKGGRPPPLPNIDNHDLEQLSQMKQIIMLQKAKLLHMADNATSLQQHQIHAAQSAMHKLFSIETEVCKAIAVAKGDANEVLLEKADNIVKETTALLNKMAAEKRMRKTASWR